MTILTQEIDTRPCSVCGDEGLYFCRMCSTHYCPDHLCLHLNVAWENNTWTERNKPERSETLGSGSNSGSSNNSTDFNFGENVDESNKIQQCSSNEHIHEFCSNEQNAISSISNNAKPLTAYTEPQLQAQLNFYISQSRRIKRELERRSLPLAGFSISEEERFVSRSRGKSRKHGRPVHEDSKISKRASKATAVLENAMRANGLTIEQIRNALGLDN